MSVRSKTTKELADRIDPLYIRQGSWKRWLVRLGVAVPAIAALAFWGSLFFKMPETARAMLNPGPVSIAHGMWETKCSTCHENDDKGKFRVEVTDRACLNCHSAPLHHPNQLLRTDNTKNNPLALAIDDHGTKRAAHCVACHVEHKGHERLTAINDINCTRCHDDIVRAVASRDAIKTANATRFDAKGNHPYFGSELAPGGIQVRPPAPLTPALVDPTHLRFGHNFEKHRDVPIPSGTSVNCTTCHIPMEQLPETIAPSPSGDTLHRMPMVFSQVNYERDCKKCHALTLDTGLPIPHVAMEAIAKQLPHLDDMYRQWLAMLPSDKRNDLTGTETPGDMEIKDLVKKSSDAADQWFGGKPWQTPLAPSVTLTASDAKALTTVLGNLAKMIQPDDNKPVTGDPRILPLFIAFGVTQTCVKCHDMNDPLASGLAQTMPSTAPAAEPAAAVATTSPAAPMGGAKMSWLSTVPTLVTSSPRRWFTHSAFDHRPHQNLTCLSCHLAAKTSVLTSDVLSPNLIWQQESGTASCADCHHPTNSAGRGARANCVTCHNFHDHAKTTAPTNLLMWDGSKKDFVNNSPSSPAPTTAPSEH